VTEQDSTSQALPSREVDFYLLKVPMYKLINNLPTLVKLTYQEWKEDNGSRLAAALTYYTVFSFAPMLIIAIAIAGLIWQKQAVQEQVLSQIQGLVGEQGRIFVAGLLESAGKPAQGIFATIIGLITLIFGALGVFNELHNSLNIIWDVPEKKVSGLWQTIKEVIVNRFLSFTMILGIGFMLLVSLMVSTSITAFGNWIGGILPFHEVILQIINLVISIGIITVLFALIFKVLPDAEIAWRDVWVGAFVTAILFSIGKTLIGLYLGSSAVGTTFGAAGSLVLLLLWVYYSAQILFFGAEFTQVYANRLGSRIVPEGQAATTPPETSKSPTPVRLPGMAYPAASNRQIIPVTGQTYEINPRMERENQQTARFFFGLLTASFLIGIMTTFFGMRKTKK
jgi:membrane protein